VKILLHDIPQGHSVMDREVPAESLDLLEWFLPQGPVRVALQVDRHGQQITFRGGVHAAATVECARCLVPLPLPIEAEVTLLADRRGTEDLRDEVALEQEGSVLYHDRLELDLGPVIREAVILEVPLAVLCRPECRGLCPRCGADLNEGPCSCKAAAEDPRWDALKALKAETPGPGPRARRSRPEPDDKKEV